MTDFIFPEDPRIVLAVSFNGQDKDRVTRLVAELRNREIVTWFSEDGRHGFGSLSAHIEEAFENAKYILICLSENGVSEYQEIERRYAQQRPGDIAVACMGTTRKQLGEMDVVPPFLRDTVSFDFPHEDLKDLDSQQNLDHLAASYQGGTERKEKELEYSDKIARAQANIASKEDPDGAPQPGHSDTLGTTDSAKSGPSALERLKADDDFVDLTNDLEHSPLALFVGNDFTHLGSNDAEKLGYTRTADIANALLTKSTVENLQLGRTDAMSEKVEKILSDSLAKLRANSTEEFCALLRDALEELKKEEDVSQEDARKILSLENALGWIGPCQTTVSQFLAELKRETGLEQEVVGLLERRAVGVPDLYYSIAGLIRQRLPHNGRSVEVPDVVVTTNIDSAIELAFIKEGISYNHLLLHRANKHLYQASITISERRHLVVTSPCFNEDGDTPERMEDRVHTTEEKSTPTITALLSRKDRDEAAATLKLRKLLQDHYRAWEKRHVWRRRFDSTLKDALTKSANRLFEDPQHPFLFHANGAEILPESIALSIDHYFELVREGSIHPQRLQDVLRRSVILLLNYNSSEIEVRQLFFEFFSSPEGGEILTPTLVREVLGDEQNGIPTKSRRWNFINRKPRTWIGDKEIVARGKTFVDGLIR